MKKQKGIFITLEGNEGSGKSTICTNIEDFLVNKNIPVVKTREPGGGKIAEQFRNIILNFDLDPISEGLAFAAARREHLKAVIIPNLTKGKLVLCDRYIDSSIVYQGYARGLGVDKVLEINSFVTEDFMPDLTIILELDIEKSLNRIKEEGREINRLDKEPIEFHTKCKEGFKMLPKMFPNRKIEFVNAEGTKEEVRARVLKVINKNFKLW